MKRTILALGHELLSYRIHEVTPYINWIYFFHAWGFQPRFAAIANIHGCDSCRALWLTTFPEEERTKASEAMQLFKEANRMLDRLDETISIHCIFRLCQANADGDNLLIEGTTFPLLRQQTPQPDGGPFLCLSDFVRPLSSGTPDIVGLFASTISEEAEETYKSDPYKHLLVQTLNDRLADAAAATDDHNIHAPLSFFLVSSENRILDIPSLRRIRSLITISYIHIGHQPDIIRQIEFLPQSVAEFLSGERQPYPL